MLATLGCVQSKGAAVGPGSGVAPGVATLGGTITTCTEANIVTGGKTITVTLSGALTWEATLGADNAVTTAFIQAFDSAQSETTGWNNIVRDTLTYAAVTRTSATVATVILPAYSGYATTATETITATIPATAVDGQGDAIVASPVITVTNVAESIALTGTAMASIVPDDIVTGSKTLIFTVTGDQFVATLGADNGITTAFLAGIDSAQSEGTGWDATVKAILSYTMLTRDSATKCTLVLPAAATYAISATETVTATVPATALLASSGSIVASPVFTVTAVSAALTGTITTADQDDIIAGSRTLVLTLSAGVTWDATLGADNALTTALIAGLDSAQSETYGWDAIVKAALTYTAVTRTSDTVATIVLPAFSGYAITANETITATIPGSAISQGAGIVATPTATIDNVSEAVALSGTAVSCTTDEIVAGGQELIFIATGDQFVATLGADNAITTAFLSAIDSAQSEAAGWDAVVKVALDYTMLTRDNATQCTLVLPAAPTYSVTATETITATVPATALLASSGSVVASPTMTVSLGVALFTSMWDTAQGTSDAAFLDTDNAVPWSRLHLAGVRADFNKSGTIVSASGLGFPTGITNCFKYYTPSDAGVNGGGIMEANSSGEWSALSLGESFYYRMYFVFNAEVGSNKAVDGSFHPIQGSQTRHTWVMNWNTGGGTTYLNWFLRYSQQVIREYRTGKWACWNTLLVGTVYRFEWKYTKVGSNLYKYDIRIYDINGLVADASSFDNNNASKTIDSFINGEDGDFQITDQDVAQFSIGTNSAAEPNDVTPGNWENFYYASGIQCRKDDWCGPYSNW